MSNEERVKYWLDSAIETHQVARESYEAAHYDWAFFQWHLAIEKLLKGLLAKQTDIPLPIHDLVKLALKAGITLTEEQNKRLDEITTYSINARYDDYKRRFYKKVNETVYHETWYAICQELFLWIKKMY